MLLIDEQWKSTFAAFVRDIYKFTFDNRVFLSIFQLWAVFLQLIEDNVYEFQLKRFKKGRFFQSIQVSEPPSSGRRRPQQFLSRPKPPQQSLQPKSSLWRFLHRRTISIFWRVLSWLGDLSIDVHLILGGGGHNLADDPTHHCHGGHHG